MCQIHIYSFKKEFEHEGLDAFYEEIQISKHSRVMFFPAEDFHPADAEKWMQENVVDFFNNEIKHCEKPNYENIILKCNSMPALIYLVECVKTKHELESKDVLLHEINETGHHFSYIKSEVKPDETPIVDIFKKKEIENEPA